MYNNHPNLNKIIIDKNKKTVNRIIRKNATCILIRSENISYSENISKIQRSKLNDVKYQVFYTVLRKQELSDSDRSDLTLQFFYKRVDDTKI